MSKNKSNKSQGTTFENEFCETLGRKGFWAHNLTQDKSGQPADVIAVKNGCGWLIDCKLLANKKAFPLSRVEENQLLAMALWKERTKFGAYFAIKSYGKVYMVPYVTVVTHMSMGLKSLDITESGFSLEKWLEERE